MERPYPYNVGQIGTRANIPTLTFSHPYDNFGRYSIRFFLERSYWCGCIMETFGYKTY